MPSISPCRSLLPISLLLLSAPFAASADARIYRWLDADGAEHFGDTPPVHGRWIKIKQPAVREPIDEAPAIDAAACAAKREQLKSYQLAGRVTETNALGETREYSDDEKRKLIANTETQVRAACGDR